jgi:cytochrome c553
MAASKRVAHFCGSVPSVALMLVICSVGASDPADAQSQAIDLSRQPLRAQPQDFEFWRAGEAADLRSGGGVAAMAEVAYPLSDDEITALAHYLARL